MDNGGCFKKYKIGDLFYVKGNPQLNKESFTFSENREYPYFTRTVFNNGIYDYVDYLDQEHLIKGNSLAVGMMACKFFYMEHDFYAGQFTKTCYPRFSKFNEKIATYFISLLNCYSDKLKGVLVRDFESTFNSIVVDLPLFSNQISFDYMESYIRELEQERIRELDAYLKATGLNDYELTPKEKNSIEIMQNGGIKYNKFRIGDLFDIRKGKRLTKADQTSGSTPFIGSTDSNNGLTGYIGQSPIFNSPAITVNYNGSVGKSYYQEQDFWASDDVNVLYLKGSSLSELLYGYLGTVLEKSSKKYSYTFKWNLERMKESFIILPVDQNDNIDYKFMTLFIKAIQKLCIKSVVDWKDRIIQTTKNVVNC